MTNRPRFTPEDRAALLQFARPERLRSREYVYHQGDPARAVYLIDSGMVKLSRLTDDAREIILEFLGPGDVFGATDFLDRATTEEFAQTLEPTTVQVIRRADFEALAARRPSILITVSRMLGHRSRHFVVRLADMVSKDARHRLADLLDGLVDHFGVPTDGGLAFPGRLTHVDLGNYIGSARETVTEALSDFAKAERIRRKGRKIIVTRRLGDGTAVKADRTEPPAAVGQSA
ncbi:MAG TPA: Crp/Fnr family transcriptional regulator [Thermodesulfobacteriota bacterium]